MFRGKLASLGGVVAVVVLGVLTPALSAPRLNLVPFSDNRVPGGPIGHYITVQGQLFVLDRESGGAAALLRFDDDAEVWVLDPSPAPRGDTLYKNDLGDTVLRITRLGGVTLFTASDPEGLPVSKLGDANAIQQPPPLPTEALVPRTLQAGVRASRATPDQHLVTFDIPRYTPQTVGVFADAVGVAANAIVRLGRRPDGRAFLARLDKVSFVMGPRPDVSVSNQTIVITLTPAKGFAGRPSSDRILKTILKR